MECNLPQKAGTGCLFRVRYAKGNNLAIKRALSDQKKYFLILNPDIEISSSFVRNLYEVITTDNSLFIVGPRIYEKDCRGIIFSDDGKLYRSNFFEVNRVNVGKK